MKVVKLILILAVLIVLLICGLLGFITGMYIPELRDNERTAAIVAVIAYAAVSIGLFGAMIKLWRWRV